MKKALKVVAALMLVLCLLAAGGFGWAHGKATELLDRSIAVHDADFPIPFPLDSAEIAELGVGPAAADSVARERARERGRHLVEARYGCNECHGTDFSGGVMVDDPLLGQLLGPNITSGEGGKTAAYTAADWDRIVRHGVRPDGAPAVMPSGDFRLMSDQELSDIIVYVRSLPAVDATVAPIELGPLGTVLVATGQLALSADMVDDHHAEHRVLPPEAGVTTEFGRHVAGVCTGCHGETFVGGPIAGGDPSWPEAANLTPHADGLADWSYDDFVAALVEARRPDGSELLEPMSLFGPYAREMTETEMQALWAYLRSLPPRASGN